MIRVLLAEDQAMVRGALAALLGLEGDIEVVVEVGRGDDVVSAALTTRPDVALLDIEMPGGDGLTAAAWLRAAMPACRVVILTTFGRSGYLYPLEVTQKHPSVSGACVNEEWNTAGDSCGISLRSNTGKGIGSPTRIRTSNLLINSQPLYH